MQALGLFWMQEKTIIVEISFKKIQSVRKRGWAELCIRIWEDKRDVTDQSSNMVQYLLFTLSTNFTGKQTVHL